MIKDGKKIIVHNFLYNAIYRILVMFIPLITTPYITRVLGADGLGRYSLSYSIASYFALFILLGVENYGNREIAKVKDNKAHLATTFWGIYGLQLLAASVVFIAYMVYCFTIANDLRMSIVMILYIISEALNINWAFFGLERFKLITIRNAVIKITSVICIFLFVHSSEDIVKYAMINVVGAFISQCILWLNVKNYIGFQRVQFKSILEHLKPNLQLFIPVIAVSLYTIMDKIMIGLITNNENVGFYEAAEKIVNIPNILVISLGTVMLPRVSNMIASGENSGNKEYLRLSIKFVMFMVSSVGFGIMAIAREFVPLFYGEGYEICCSLFFILIPSRFFMAFANVLRTQYLIPYNKDKTYISSVVAGAAVNLLMNTLLISPFGSVGAAVGTLLAEATVCFVQCFSIRKNINILQLIWTSLPFIFVGVLMFIIVSNIPFVGNTVLTIAIKVLVGASIYLGCIGTIALLKNKNPNLHTGSDKSQTSA